MQKTVEYERRKKYVLLHIFNINNEEITPFALSIKYAIWPVYIMSLISIAICNCLSVVVFGILKCNIPHVEI